MGSVKRIVICGGGVIGAAIAYFSSRRGARPIVIERHEVAGAASGKSGALSRNGGRGAPPRHRRGPDVRPERSRARCENSKANRIETMKGAAESGEICSVDVEK
jgi:glycine/D-amino acid oxidase-like deaminating enzyme